MTKMKGSIFASGHQSFTRGLLRDKSVEVISRGSSFYNENNFPILPLITEFCAHVKFTNTLSLGDFQAICKRASKPSEERNTIVIAATPDYVDKTYRDRLDGGILHESFHSLYTERGFSVNWDRARNAIHANYRKDVVYHADILRKLFNVYEDAFIERKGIQEFRGALSKIQKVHEMVWEQERKNRRKRDMSFVGHILCYLRDRLQDYLIDAPLLEYDEDARILVDLKLSSLIEQAKDSVDSYDSLRLALLTVNMIQDIEPEEETADKASQASSEEDLEPSEFGDAAQKDGEGSTKAKGLDSSSEGSSGDEEPSGGMITRQNKMVEIIKRDASAQGHEDINKALQKNWDREVVTKEIHSVFVPTQEYDDIIRVVSKPEDEKLYKRTLDHVIKNTMHIRPKMISFFRGRIKTKTEHGLKSGSRISGKLAHRIITDKDPKPFQKQTWVAGKNSCVSILMDESESMDVLAARNILLTLASVFGKIRIPNEIIGFTTNEVDLLKKLRIKDRGQFTRTEGCRYRVFRTFEDPHTDKAYHNLVLTERLGRTPLPDGIEFSARRLIKREEDQKILLVITDGQPFYANTTWNPMDYLLLMRKQVTELNKAGIRVLFVGVGYHAEYITRFFENSVTITDYNDFPRKMSEFLFQQLKLIMKENHVG